MSVIPDIMEVDGLRGAELPAPILPVLERRTATHRPTEPKLAIIISCYNYAGFVGHAIGSVLGQVGLDWELVVVDDGSTDGSWEAISAFDVTAFRIVNCGQRAACLFGLSQTTAPFVLFLDADDALKPGSLGTIIPLLAREVAKLQFSLTRIDAQGNVLGTDSPLMETYRGREELARCVLRTGVYRTPPTSGNVFRRDVCDLLREAEYDSAVDGIILFAAPFLGDVVSRQEALGCYRVHDRNDSGLGRAPDAQNLRRDIGRFEARMAHLRSFLRAHGRDNELAAPQATYYHRQQSFFLAIQSGARPGATAMAGLLTSLMRERFRIRPKLAMTAFFILGFLLPNDRARALLAYRLSTGPRSLARALRAVRAVS